jgi:hypothetical protein
MKDRPGGGPGPRIGAVNVHHRAVAEPVSLEAELQAALEDAGSFEHPGPDLARRLERVARAILLRRGLRTARAVARSDAHGTSVHVILPADGPRVREIVVRMTRG